MDFWRVEDAVGGSVDVEDKEEASDDKYKEDSGIVEMDSRAERSDFKQRCWAWWWDRCPSGSEPNELADFTKRDERKED